MKKKTKKKNEKPVAPVACVNISFAFHSLLDISLDIHGGFWSYNLQIKIFLLPSFPKVTYCIVCSSLIWKMCGPWFYFFFPDSDVRLGSVAVSLQTFTIIFAARSQKSFCLMLRNFRLYITCNIIYQNYSHNGNLYLISHNITKMT